MNKSELIEFIEKEKLVAIIRMKENGVLDQVVEAMIEGGIKLLEITSNTPGVWEWIARNKDRYPEAIIGAGTITNRSLAEKAAKAGAKFLVSPNFNREVIGVAQKQELVSFVGAMTPTEICDAHEAGADFVKLFPANLLGIPYLKSIMAPLDQIKVFAVGGVKLDNVQDWLDAGAYGVGLGSSLISSTILKNEGFEGIKKRSEEFVKAVSLT